MTTESLSEADLTLLLESLTKAMVALRRDTRD